MDRIEMLITDFVQVAQLAGLPITTKDITHQELPCPHRPVSLPKGKQAVYVFWMPDPHEVVLKVGKVGPNSGARFVSQHYLPSSSASNLAKSLLNDNTFWSSLGVIVPPVESVGEWVRRYTCRTNLYLLSDTGPLALSLFEVFLQCRLKPRYEG